MKIVYFEFFPYVKPERCVCQKKGGPALASDGVERAGRVEGLRVSDNSSVGRASDCSSCAAIGRSLVRIRVVGSFLLIRDYTTG